MLRGLFGCADSFESRVLWDIDSGASGGAGGGEDDDDTVSGGGHDDPPKTFTQEEVEKLIQDRLKKSKREAKQRDVDLKNAQTKIADLERQINELAAGDGKGADAGKLELLQQKHQRELADLKTQLNEAQQSAKDAELRRREVERDTLLTTALSAVGCTDLEGGRRWAAPQIVWDELEGGWQFTTKSGNVVDISEGIAEELPKYLRPNSLTGAGSGTPSGAGGRKAAAQKELADEKAELDKCAAAVRKAPQDTSLTLAYQKQKQKVTALESKIATIK